MKYLIALPVALALLLGTALPGRGHGHGFHGHSFHGHFVPRSRVFVGGPVFVGPGFWGPPYPYWWDPYWGPAYSYPPPVVIHEEPQVYVQQPAPAPPAPPSYWYYCADAKAYYPYVQQCPAGWLKVIPEPTAPGR